LLSISYKVHGETMTIVGERERERESYLMKLLIAKIIASVEDGAWLA
jgi:hypothetical protein